MPKGSKPTHTRNTQGYSDKRRQRLFKTQQMYERLKSGSPECLLDVSDYLDRPDKALEDLENFMSSSEFNDI